jgi:hypothetical protein
LIGPDQVIIGSTPRRFLQRNTDLVIIVDQVISEPDHIVNFVIIEVVSNARRFHVRVHEKLSILSQIKIDRFEHASYITTRKVADLQAQCLFIQQQVHIVVAQLLLPDHSRRRFIRDRCTRTVLFNING